MLDFKNEMQLYGDFKTIENVIHLAVDLSQPLKSITDELISQSFKIQCLDESKIYCLKEFLKHKSFYEWLKHFESIKDIKVLIDLAMISADGQGDYEVEKVHCMHAAATGYAPLIFDLKENMGFDDLWKLCETVWKALEKDPELPQKFNDSSHQIEWWKRLNKSHGSVEVSAISSATSINQTGIYVVGNLHSLRETPMSLNDVILLNREVEKDEVQTCPDTIEKKMQTLTLQHLTDIQSKLMLVAGKAIDNKKQDIYEFVENMNAILRLGEIYIEIYKAGCNLFHEFKALFYCNFKKKISIKLEFGVGRNKHSLCQLRNKNFNTCEEINLICDFLKQCLNHWKSYLDKQRSQAFYLNYFTTEQLVSMQTELAKCLTDKDINISPKIFHLLSIIDENLDNKKIRETVKSAFQQMAIDEIKNNEVNDIPTSKEEENNKEKVQMIKELSQYDFSKNLILHAVSQFNNFEEAMFFCLDTQNIELMDDDSSSMNYIVGSNYANNTLQFSEYKFESTKEDKISDTWKNLLMPKDFILDNLQKLWQDFVSEIDQSFKNCISIKHLGTILKTLSNNSQMNKNSSRCLPNEIKIGQPNLIVCNQGDVLPTVLSLFICTQETTYLPKIDEVVLCNKDTTFEEVELLLHRAEGDAKHEHLGKLYCLAHAELLDYEIATKVSKSLQQHCFNLNQLKLVVVCSSQCEDKTLIISSLERFRVKYAPICLNDIKSKLKIILQNSSKDSAASVDPEKCCIRFIKSHRAGVGKSLKILRLIEDLEQKLELNHNEDENEDYNNLLKSKLCVKIPIYTKNMIESDVIKMLEQHILPPEDLHQRIFHIDIAHEVQTGVDHVLFKLLLLGSIQNIDGIVWSRRSNDLYLIENMPLLHKQFNYIVHLNQNQSEVEYVHRIFNLLPSLTCWSPCDCLAIMKNDFLILNNYVNTNYQAQIDQLIDNKQFISESFQRPFKYLKQYSNNQILNAIDCLQTIGTPNELIETFLCHCGISDPSWSELQHFTSFLNYQLTASEKSVFCQPFLAPDLPGFLKFVISSMIMMSRDFAMRSLKISEETAEIVDHIFNPELNQKDNQEQIFNLYQLKRTWESSPHPYLFFNADNVSFTFMGFIVSKSTGDLLDPYTGQVLIEKAIPSDLYQALVRNRVNLNENFDTLTRIEKLNKIFQILGKDYAYDPDPTYELTADNVKKILAIYMRFRCNIPVIIMGETGCGKTRLIKFLCDLFKLPNAPINNMILSKVHGGITSKNIEDLIQKAREEADKNCEHDPDMQTILFFDEANTTEAIGTIKQIMCDLVNNNVTRSGGLKLIAACNPYRKHDEIMIKRLEQAGLGYHVHADKTKDKLGLIPMRHLVYRVQALPQSMLPLVWDFGQLNIKVERLYIRQMIHKHIKELEISSSYEASIADILTEAQKFMREQNDECSFVSLRNVERCLIVMAWFYVHGQEYLFEKMDDWYINKKESRNTLTKLKRDFLSTSILNKDNKDEDFATDKDYSCGNQYEDENESIDDVPNEITRSLILALGVCYHACLQNRQAFRHALAKNFNGDLHINNPADIIEREIDCCQEVLLSEVLDIGDHIARNHSLKENFFMMVVCIELRIPLFLVGKPGSSKSLAKTIVANAMQGEQSKSNIFKKFKSVHMVSYQCSPLSTSEGIVGTFKQCANFQKAKDLNSFVSVVVLDEVGLAEDSDKMPLKALHPLLEDGCEGDEMPEPYKKVGFIGISNWSLDPAKMNRGILVQRGVPDLKELIDSAKGICGDISQHIEYLIEPLSNAYSELYSTTISKKEFFGLRDFYSLIKMTNYLIKLSNRPLIWNQLKRIILRNFGGLNNTNSIDIFKKHLCTVMSIDESNCQTFDSASLIQEALNLEANDSESRYLLILTQNYTALDLLQNELMKLNNAFIIFGSSFPYDLEYTQICRNINKIKVCMETGRTVVLLNLENLYESLYDAFNQYYIYLNGQRFVDLGLGTQRVKCIVHKNFRLLVVAEQEVVYNKFPIPLINRLEKHFLTTSSILNDQQKYVVEHIQDWMKQFLCINSPQTKLKESDIFMGYHEDAIPSVVMQIGQKSIDIIEEAKYIFIQTATPDAITRLSIGNFMELKNIYFKEQRHESLLQFLKFFIHNSKFKLTQISTHGRLIFETAQLCEELGLANDSICLYSLNLFNNEQQFCTCLQEFYSPENPANILILQCEFGDKNSQLIACAKYIISNEYTLSLRLYNQQQEKKNKDSSEFYYEGLNLKKYIVFIIQLQRIDTGSFVGFQGGHWLSYHIDDLHIDKSIITPLLLMHLEDKPISAIFKFDKNLSTIKQESLIYSNQLDTTNSDQFYFDDLQTDDLDELNKSEYNEIQKKENFNSQINTTLNNLNINGFETILNEFSDILIRKCLHLAVSKTKELVDSDRFSQRLIILNSLLDPLSGNDEFLIILKRRVGILLNEKEEIISDGQINYEWMSKNAASYNFVAQHGTFRKSVTNFLENQISPIFGYIISIIDRNHNLDMLQEDKILKQIWLTMFNEINIVKFKYSDIQFNIQNQKEINHFNVVQSSKFKFPFSWIIINFIDNLFLKSKLEHQTNDIILNLFKSNYLGQFLENNISKLPNYSQLLNYYLHDLVYYKLFSKINNSLDPYDMIISWLEIIINKDKSELQNCIYEDILMMHLIFNKLSIRFSLFLQFSINYPDGVKKIQKKVQHFQNLDVEALIYLLEYFLPSKEDINKEKLRVEWMLKVCSNYNLIEKLLSVCKNDFDLQPFYLELREKWNRIQAISMFIDNVCPPELPVDEYAINDVSILCKILETNANFKELKSFETINKCLQIFNKRAIKHYLKCENLKCILCNETYNNPYVFPCNHVSCDECFKELKEFNWKCKVCNQIVPKDIKHVQESSNWINLNNYKRRCNCFIMDLLTNLCFSNNEPPCKELIDRLMDDIILRNEGIKTTRNILLDSIDATPIIRSFILQLLLKTNIENVKIHLDAFFSQFMCLIPEKQIGELCLLIIHCFEDYFIHDYLGLFDATSEHKIKYIKKLWNDNNLDENLGSNQITITSLMNIAIAKFGLSILTKLLDENIEFQNKQLNIFLDVVHNLITKCKSARLYLLRDLVFTYGIISLRRIVKKCNLKWMIDSHLEIKDTKPDLFIIYGNNYKKLRDAFTEAYITSDLKEVNSILKTLHPNDPIVLIAIYQGIISSNKNNNLNEEKIEMIQKSLKKKLNKNNQKIVSDLLTNKISDDIEKTSIKDKLIDDLIMHWYIVSQLLPNDSVLFPLSHLTNHPMTMKDSYLPSMPQDEFYDIRNSIISKRVANENPHFYACENGHIYIIGNCGQAMVENKCPACGSIIGGKNHIINPSNRVIDDNSMDETKTGHIIGRAVLNGWQIERMNRLQTSIIRAFLHISMAIAERKDQQAINDMIKPTIPLAEIKSFLFEHLCVDLRNISISLGCNEDDAMICMHVLIQKCFSTKIKERLSFDSKKSRNEWEIFFIENILNEYLGQLSSSLNEMNQLIQNDERLGDNALMKLVYEVDQNNTVDFNAIETSECVWRKKIFLNMNQLSLQLLSANNHQLDILQSFLQKADRLSYIRYLPNLIHLQNILIAKYHRVFEVSDANKTHIISIIDDEKDNEVLTLIKDFIIVWEGVRRNLKNYVFLKTTCPIKYINEPLTLESSLMHFLPSMKGKGLCSLALLHYLIDLQNQFLEEYALKVKIKIDKSVNLSTITFSDIISLNLEIDLQPLIMANSTYFLKENSNTEIEYDFANMQRQVIFKYLRGKPKINFQIQLMTFKESSNVEIFDQIHSVIPQEDLSNVHLLEHEFKSISDISDFLSYLNIAIEYLVLGADSSMTITDYLTNILKMRCDIKRFSSIRYFTLKQIRSLWLHLNLIKAKLQIKVKKDLKDIFETVEDKYFEDLPDELQHNLKRCLNHIDVNLLLTFLYECIIFNINARKYNYDDDDNSQQILKEVLWEYIIEKGIDTKELIALNDDRFPSQIKVSQCLHTFSFIICNM